MNTFFKIKTFFEFLYKFCKTRTFWWCEQIWKGGTFLEFVKKMFKFLKLPEHYLNLWTRLKNMNYYWICEQIWKAGTFFSIPKHFLNLENKFWNREQFWKILNKFGSANIFWKREQKNWSLVHYINFESFELFCVTRTIFEFWEHFLKTENSLETRKIF